MKTSILVLSQHPHRWFRAVGWGPRWEGEACGRRHVEGSSSVSPDSGQQLIPRSWGSTGSWWREKLKLDQWLRTRKNHLRNFRRKILSPSHRGSSSGNLALGLRILNKHSRDSDAQRLCPPWEPCTRWFPECLSVLKYWGETTPQCFSKWGPWCWAFLQGVARWKLLSW